MRIKVLGKQHREGVSKKNDKPYNFNEIYYIGPKRYVEGVAGLTSSLDGVAYPYDSIIVGQEYNIEHDASGFVIEFTPVK